MPLNLIKLCKKNWHAVKGEEFCHFAGKRDKPIVDGP